MIVAKESQMLVLAYAVLATQTCRHIAVALLSHFIPTALPLQCCVFTPVHGFADGPCPLTQ